MYDIDRTRLSEDDYDGPGDIERREIQDNVHGLITVIILIIHKLKLQHQIL